MRPKPHSAPDLGHEKTKVKKAIHQGDHEKQSVNFFNSHKAHFLSIVHIGLCTGTNWTRICNKSPNDNPIPELTSSQSGTMNLATALDPHKIIADPHHKLETLKVSRSSQQGCWVRMHDPGPISLVWIRILNLSSNAAFAKNMYDRLNKVVLMDSFVESAISQLSNTTVVWGNEYLRIIG